MTKLKITGNDINLKLCDYIKKIAPNYSITKIKKMINQGDVKVNHHHVYDNYLLKINDELIIYFNFKKPNNRYLKTSIKIPIFYEDNNIIIFDKPKNIACQENQNEKINTLNNYLKKYCLITKQWDGFNKENEPSLINRIDQNTMGLVLAGKNKLVTRILNKHINDQIIKKYLAVIYNKPKKHEGLLIDFIKKSDKDNYMHVFNSKKSNSSLIKTKYRLLYSNHKYSVLEIELLTGKKHQIRAHLAYHKMYIVGDHKYGIKDKKLKINSQLLIANQIIFKLKDKNLSYLNNIEFIKYKDYKNILELIY